METRSHRRAVLRFGRVAVRAGVLASAIAVGAPLAASAAGTPAPTPGPSAIGSENPNWIQVAPNYQRTGLVVAVASATRGCSSNCIHLWVSRDGGASWARPKASGWDGGRPVIAVDGRGHDVLYSSTSAGVIRSDDAGDTWVVVGPTGTPTVSPTYARDGGTVAVAVATGGDYLLKDAGRSPVPGSGGSVYDMGFAYAPSYPKAGKYSPVLSTAEDKSNQRLPVIQQCSSAYVCTGNTTLAGAVYFSSPVALHPSSAFATDGTVFAQSGRGIFKSIDGGQSFAPIPLGDPTATATATPMLTLAPGFSTQGPVKTAWAAVFQIFQNKSNPQASHAGGDIYRTDDAGATWHPVDSPGPFDGGTMAVEAGPDGRLFAGYVGGTTGYSGLLCSTDGGTTWQATCPAEGSATNDPGPVPGSVHPCTTCTPAPLPSAAPNSPASAAAGANANNSTDPLSGGTTGPGGNTNAITPAVARPGTGRGVWAWIAVVTAIGLAALALVRFTVQRSRRTRSAVDVPAE